MHRITTLCFLFLLLSSNAFSQNKELKTKFGKFSDKETAMTVYEKDPAAAAVVLFDKGNLSHRYDQYNGFSISYERNMRLKVFKKEALSAGDLYIFHYKDEKISDFKASSFNLENGKMVETKLDKENLIDENLTKNFMLAKFSVPAVREGSIIEFSYKLIQQRGVDMPNSWTFQHVDYPTIWSEFEASVPEFIQFKKMAQGWVPFSLAEEGPANEKMNFTLKDRAEGRMANTTFDNITLDYTVNKMHFIQEDIPALKPEPYVNASRDYLSRINFDVQAVYNTDVQPTGSTYRLVNTTPTNYNITWKKLGWELLDDVYEKDLNSAKNTEDAAKKCTTG